MKENNGKSDMDLMEKAQKMMSDYNQATGSSICIYDSSYKPLFPANNGNNTPEIAICPHCTHTDCQNLHKNSIKEAISKGGSHIYQCSLGLVFWTSPIYTDGAFSGAIRGSGFLPEIKKTVDFFLNANDTHVMCNEKSLEEAKERINSFPKADDEKVQSLAEMMQICAESLSSGSEDYHEILRRRAEQQEAIKKIIEELEKAYPENTEKPGYSLEKEKILLNALRKGDPIETRTLLNELIAAMIFSYRDQFKYMQLRTTELVVLFSRVEVVPVKNGSLSLEINNQCLKLIQEAKNTEELTDILHTVIDRILNNIASFRGIPHAAALRKAENFIIENYTRKISLKEIADTAGLSPPYFSTIFKEEMGENLSKYLNRLRVEKASRMLLETDMSLSEIAACCCFEDQSWFSKIFKAFTGISPGKYRNQGGGIIRNITENNLSQAFRKTLKK
ncbi:MAG: helix-turn-helix domain-containing protein [Treponema sp.]|jgi:AraC-like DNA-binding protein/ligand-binding sensor protein|nr:helix-turn-helix domain-containing protein [Treponema sp.]